MKLDDGRVVTWSTQNIVKMEVAMKCKAEVEKELREEIMNKAEMDKVLEGAFQGNHCSDA